MVKGGSDLNFMISLPDVQTLAIQPCGGYVLLRHPVNKNGWRQHAFDVY